MDELERRKDELDPGAFIGHEPEFARDTIPGGVDEDDERPPWQPETLVARAAVVALHLLPGVLAYVLLRTAREPLQRELGITSAEAQIGVIMTGVMLLMGAATFGFAKAVDGRSPGHALRLVGARGVDPRGLVAAVAIWLVVVAVPLIVDYEDAVRSLVEGVDWLALPSWHFQATDGFQQLPPLLGVFALAANLLCEELWFRGYLQDKLRFLGRLGWVAAGLLFILYHVFEAPVAYPGILGGLGLAGLWAWRHDLWSCVLLHALLNAPV